MKALVQEIAETRAEADIRPRRELVSAGPKLGGPTLKQPTSDWSATDNFTEIRNFSLEENNLLQTYYTNYADMLPII